MAWGKAAVLRLGSFPEQGGIAGRQTTGMNPSIAISVDSSEIYFTV
ncbi:hypothetical protein [Rhizobium leguminosarum]|nr:hypothetical protein [Rhizobium leguminosarum]